ncbi:MAG: spermidine/putrescine ABC transporter substrate-binding protein, partial [Chloroflexi bacterium]
MAVVMVLSACGTSGPSGMLQELGDGEGELNLIIWSGYAEEGAVEGYDWVNPFEEDTGCQVNSTVMNDSGHGVQLLQ